MPLKQCFNRFVSLDNNNRFQDRELKSIKIQADCEYIRLVIKGCHENRLNVHKQVSEKQTKRKQMLCRSFTF